MQLLEMAQGEYRVQETKDERNMRYDTTYFDTLDFNMFHVHQTGHTGRQKLRFRTYVSSNLQFMEVKTKNNHGRTKKKRIEVTDMIITGQQREMGNLVIIELKRDGLVFSPVLGMLRQLRIHPHGFSKYCMGAALTNEELQVNRFKPKLRDVERILSQSNNL